jgi:ADP-ribose pyrophosphatase YjhB (NUDIX family)
MFFIGAEGLVQDQFGRVLMIQRDDSRTWALPGGGLDVNELPSDGMVREVFEETGYKVHPIRLTQLTYIRGREQDLLIFVLRGILRGGAAQTSAESLQVAFVKTDRLPRMTASHRERLQANLHHPGGPPYLRQQERLSWSLRLLRRLVYRVKDGQRWWRGHLPYVPPNPWYIQAVVILQNEQSQVWWQECNGVWTLPGGACPVGQPPWDAAAKLAQAQLGQPVMLTDLAGVYVTPNNKMTLCFVGKIELIGNAAAGQWASLEEMGDAAAESYQRFVQDSLTPRETTFFHTIPTA